MKIRTINILTLFLVMVAITGTAIAIGPNEEKLVAAFLTDKLLAKSWNFQDHDDNKPKIFCYQIRFYPPSGNFPVSDPKSSEDQTTGFYAGKKFVADNAIYSETSPRLDELTNPSNGWEQGTWYVVLMKNGSSYTDSSGKLACHDPNEFADSYRLFVGVDIPEFSTVAIPIAGVLGLVFYFQHRKKKEE